MNRAARAAQLRLGPSLRSEAGRAGLRLAPLAVTLAGPLASGAALAAGTPPLEWTALAWVALVPLGLAVVWPAPAHERMFGALLGGLVFHWWGLSWTRTAFAVDNLHGPRANAVLLLCLLAAGSWPLAVGLGQLLARRLPLALALPVAWISGEYARFLGFRVFGGDGFPVLQVGHLAIDSSGIEQLASVGGVWAVSLLVVAVNGYGAARWFEFLSARGEVPSQARRRRRRQIWETSVLLAVLGAALAFGQYRLGTSAVRYDGPIVCLMGDLEPWLERERSLAPFNLGGAELLLWPEASLESKIRQSADDPSGNADPVLQRLTRLAADRRASLVVSGVRHEASSGLEFNSAWTICPERGVLGRYDKKCRVPFAEFQPNWAPWFETTAAAPIAAGSRSPVFAVASQRGDRTPLALMICYDLFFPGCARDWVRTAEPRDQPLAFLVASSEACDPQGRLAALVQVLARYRALETGRSIVRNTRGGWCGLIDPLGREAVRTADPSRAGPQWVGAVPTSIYPGRYARWGDWLAQLCGCLAVLAVGHRAWGVAAAWRLPAPRAGRAPH